MVVSKAQKKATSKWEKKKYDKILIRLPKGTKEQLKENADLEKVSLNKYIESVLLHQMQNQKESGVYKTSDGRTLINFSTSKNINENK